MTFLTREEFLNYVHTPLVNPQGDPNTGSPTKSTMRYRWRELRHWDVEAEAREYWDHVTDDDKQARLVRVRAGHWEHVRTQLDLAAPFTSETDLRGPFENAFRIPLNAAIFGASDEHAEMRGAATGLDGEPRVANPDFIFVYDNKLTGIIELKTWWKVNAVQINEVKEEREPLEGVHHGRLAVEQTYGYMLYDEIRYGIISTFNSFVFLRRENPGILYMSRIIPNNLTPLTIMELLYFFSHLCARDPLPYPETNSDGIAIYLTKAEKTSSLAPKVPNPNRPPTRQTILPDVDLPPNPPRRSPRRHDTSISSKTVPLYLDIGSHGSGAYLGCKGWRGTLSTGRIVFAKLWDGWKFSPRYCEHEASIYLQLRDLWGTIVPEYLGSGRWGFCHVLLLSYIECPMLYQVAYNSTIGKNVLKAFKSLHARKIYHGDIRLENILVRPDQSVVIIDFESSEMNADSEVLKSEMKEVISLLAGMKPR